MAILSVAHTMNMCSFGVAPNALETLPLSFSMGLRAPGSNIMSATPFAEMTPFVLCTSMANPAVATATAAALGVLTPMPCTPMTAAWTPGSPTVLLGGMPALNNSSMCMCGFAGVVSMSFPGQAPIMVP